MLDTATLVSLTDVDYLIEGMRREERTAQKNDCSIAVIIVCYQGEPLGLNLECHNGGSLSSGEISLLNDPLCIVKLSETERLNGF